MQTVKTFTKADNGKLSKVLEYESGAREDLRNKYQLAFICEQYMRAEIKDHFRVQNAQKRKPMETIISLDANHTETDNLYNLVGGKSVEDELLESELLEEVLENLSEWNLEETESLTQ